MVSPFTHETKMKSILLLSLFAATGFTVASAFDQAPRPLSTVMPVIPSEWIGRDGHIDLAVEINAAGLVTHAEIKSSTLPGLDQPCLNMIRRWRFVPATQDGKPAGATFIQPVDFSNGLISATPRQPASRSPIPTQRVAPVLPEALQHIVGSTVVAVNLDAEGREIDATINASTHEELNTPSLEAIRQWKFSPAIAQGSAIASTVYVPILFNGAPLPVDELARLDPPAECNLQAIRQGNLALPRELIGRAGEVAVTFVVDEHGYGTDVAVPRSSEPAMAHYAQETVLQWKFKPAIRDGQAVAVRVAQLFRFSDGLVSTESPTVVDRLPVARKRVAPVIPEVLRGVSGRVAVEFAIDAQGAVTAVAVKDATLPEFTEPTLAAARQWKFSAAQKQGTPTPCTVVVPFVFGS